MTQKTILERAEEAFALLASLSADLPDDTNIEDSLSMMFDFISVQRALEQAEADQHEEYLKSLKSINTFEGTYGEFRG